MGKYISLANKDGYEYVTRNIGKDGAVVIIASQYKNDRVAFQLILSTRPTFDKPILEFPAGLLDIYGESIADSAKRELWEETGWSDATVIEDRYMTLPVPSSAGLTDEVLYLVNIHIPAAAVRGPSAHTGGEKIRVLPMMDIHELRMFIDIFRDQIYVSSRVLAFITGYSYCPGSAPMQWRRKNWLDSVDNINDIPNTEDGI